MSYILDALRRLEQDKERTRKGANPVEAVLVPDLELEKPRGRMPFRWLGLGLVLLAVAVGATYWITRRTVVFSTPQVRETPSPHLTSAAPREDPPVLTRVPDPASPGSSGTRISGEAQPAPRAAPTEAVPQPIEPETLPDDRVSASLEEDTLSSPIEPDTADFPPETFEGEVILPWEGEEIKINAIAWSRARDRRFALVNLKTVHEGDQVDGLSVVAIEEDGIVFEREGTKYRVLLGKR